jgi:UPF0271 protein
LKLKTHRIDLNCDVGEGVGNEAFLFPHISSCNIACGGHAGDADSMRQTAVLAREYSVKVGAHPSYPDREHFGRVHMALSREMLRASIEQQIRSLEQVLGPLKIPIHHIKAHGALYNDLAAGGPLALQYLEVLEPFASHTLVYAPCGSAFARLARDRGFEVWEEAFADRAYQSDGSLVSRKTPGALLTSPQQVSQQVREMVLSGRVRCIDGSYFYLNADTFCLHGDTPNAGEILKVLIKSLSRESIHVQK